MLYLLYGEEKEKARVKAHEMIESLKKKKPDAEFFKVESENWNEATLEEYIGGQGLFSNKYIVFVDSVFENKDIQEILIGKLKEIGGSENIFIFLEGVLTKALLSKFEKHAEKVQNFTPSASALPRGSARQGDFNIFSLGDALGKRDKKTLWVLYDKAKRAGLVEEQIHGTLFWSVKNMILAESTSSASEAGLSPFVFSKAKEFSRNWKGGELKKLSTDLVSLYNDSRRGIFDFDVALEKFILTL